MLQNGLNVRPQLSIWVLRSRRLFTFHMINGDHDAQMFSGNPELYLLLDTRNIYRLGVEGLGNGELHL